MPVDGAKWRCTHAANSKKNACDPTLGKDIKVRNLGPKETELYLTDASIYLFFIIFIYFSSIFIIFCYILHLLLYIFRFFGYLKAKIEVRRPSTRERELALLVETRLSCPSQVYHIVKMVSKG